MQDCALLCLYMEAGFSAAGRVSALLKNVVIGKLMEWGGKVGALITRFSSSGFDSDKRGCKALGLCVLGMI